MTFLEAALEVLRREGKPLHYKELAERAMGKKLLTFVGRTPEVTMQTQLTAAVKKAPGNPFVRVKPGIFGLLRYPELPPEVEAEPKSRAAEPKARAGQAEGDAAAAEGEAGRARRRRRRGGRGRTRSEGAAAFSPNGHKPDEADVEASGDEAGADSGGADTEGGDEHEPRHGNLSAEARAAALAETGVLEGDDSGDDDAGDLDEPGAGTAARSRAAGDDDLGDDEEEGPGASARGGSQGGAEEGSDEGAEEGSEEGAEEGAEGGVEAGAAGSAADRPGEAGDDAQTGRRRRRRRRRRHGEERVGGAAPGGVQFGAPAGAGAASGALDSGGESGGPSEDDDDESLAGSASSDNRGAASAASDEGRERPTGEAGGEAADAGPGSRRIMTPVDAAIEILRGQAPGRGVHVRQIADAAARRRLVHGEPNEAWRVMRTALAAEPRERLRAGQRPRVRAAGSGLFALARRPPDSELERAEQVFGEARRALRERTVAALERRIAELPAPAFEALARVLLQREGFGPATFVKRVEGTIYVEALRGRGSRPSRSLVGLRPGASSAGRRAIGELRAGIRARTQDEGVLLMAGRLAEDAIAEWKQAGPPVEIADGQAMAETCIRHGVGVINTMVSVDFVDADFFAELSEG